MLKDYEIDKPILETDRIPFATFSALSMYRSI